MIPQEEFEKLKSYGRQEALDELETIMYRMAFEEDSDLQKWDSGCWIRYKMFENALDEVRNKR